MEHRILGSTGMRVPVLGFGGSEIGFQGAELATVENLLHSALDQGLNVIDTAECYKRSEELIGRAVAGRRNDYFLFTKTGHVPSDGDHWNPAKMAAGIDHSLHMLQTDYVDLLQIHSCTKAQLEAGDVIDVVRRARDAGKTRFIGYSGDGEAALWAVRSGIFDTLQTSLNIADQQAIELTMPEAKDRGMGVIVKRPIANAAWKTGAKPTDSYHHSYWDRLLKLDYPFLKGDLGKAVERALRFTLSVPGVTLAIVGTRNPDRWAENVAMAGAGALPREEFEAIRRRWHEVAGPDWVGQT